MCILYRVLLYHMLLLFIGCSLCFTNPASWLPQFQQTFVYFFVYFIIGHFGDNSFQAIKCTGTDNQTITRKKYTEHKITNNTKKLATVTNKNKHKNRVSNRSAGMISSRLPGDIFAKIQQNLQFYRHLPGRVTNPWDHVDPVQAIAQFKAQYQLILVYCKTFLLVYCEVQEF